MKRSRDCGRSTILSLPHGVLQKWYPLFARPHQEAQQKEHPRGHPAQYDEAMVSQSLSSENFRRIVDQENRRGVYLEGMFFPEIKEVTQSIKDCMFNIRELQKKKRLWLPDFYRLQKAILNEERLKLEEKKEDLLTKELEKISAEVAAGASRVQIHPVITPGGKATYAADKTAKSYFILKQLQHNIFRLYKVRQSSRHEIICQLKQIFGDPFPKYIIRTDIKDFYESIPQEDVLKKLDEDALLTPPSRKIIRQILEDYRDLPGNPTGVPRGVGISAYLSELYMRRFDENIRAHNALIYYARYVDDIVVVFSMRPESKVGQLLPFLKKQAANLRLSLNPDKTSKHNLRTPKACSFEYLGYELTFGKDRVKVGLSDKGRQKYKNRIKQSFEAYTRQAKYKEKAARRLLVKRIKFLTGNTRLLNNKKNIMVGIYFSNSLLSDSSDLQTLDDSLMSRIQALHPGSLKVILSKLSFKQGFDNRRYHRFSTQELNQIVKLWEHET